MAGVSAMGPSFDLYQPKEKPFWEVKRAAQQRLHKKKEILVSVTSKEVEEGDKKQEQLFLKGVGVVETDWASARKKALEFEKLKELSPDHFLEVSHNQLFDRLYIHGVAMKFHAKMMMQLYEEIDEKQKWSRLHFKIISGAFKGMVGFIQLKGIGQKSNAARQTEFSMTAFYQSEKLPLPAFLLSFGLEAVIKVVAKKMRHYLAKSQLGAEETGAEQSIDKKKQENRDDGKTSFSPSSTGDRQHLFSRTFSCLGG